jgi:hypothetical protein
MTEELLFPPHKGWDPFAPTRTLTPDGPAYRDMQNFRIGDDFLKRRAQVLQNEGLAQPSNLAASDSPFEREYPLHLWVDNPGDFNAVNICITNKRVLYTDFLDQSGGAGPWWTINPIIDEGAGATWTQGSPTVTGVVATANKYMPLPGDILTVNDGRTALGVILSYANPVVTLTAPVIEPNGVDAWQVRKPINYDRAHFRVFNGDLYVAAVWELGNTFVNPADPRDGWGVYRWSNLRQFFGFPPQPQNSTWLCANKLFDGDPTVPVPPPYREIYNNVNGNQTGIPNNAIDHDSSNVLIPGSPERVRVRGLDLLQDGRVVCPISTEQYDDRVFYSSQINDPQIHWNTSPGGFVDPVGVEGQLMVMGRLGNQLTFHYQKGIVVGTPTGQDDPPLAFQATREIQGCTLWRTLVNVNPAIETFVGPDLRLYSFNGSAVDSIGAQLKPGIIAPSNLSSFAVSQLFTSWDSYARELSIWQFGTTSPVDASEQTYRVTFNFDTGVWTRDYWHMDVTAASVDSAFFEAAQQTRETDRTKYALVGMYARNSIDPVQYQGMLGYLGELHALEYQPPWAVRSPPESYVELDNYGLGVQTIEIEYVNVEVQRPIPGTPNDETVAIQAIFDANPVPERARIITLPDERESRVYKFEEFNNNSGEKLRVRISLRGGAAGEFHSALGMIRLGINPAGEVRSEGQDVD